eukprot:g6949.t1
MVQAPAAPSSAEPVAFAAAETAARASVETGREAPPARAEAGWAEPTSRAPWDPRGCQTIVFFHVPKTGGESMNELWMDMKGRERLPWWKEGYHRTSMRVTGLEPEKQKTFLKSMKPWMREAPFQRHKVIELHCGDAISFMQAGDVLDVMRAEHERNDCGFFAFTMIRQPLDWIVSLYDDICHRRLRGHKDTCPQNASMTPKEEMLAYPHRDGIVSYLTHGFKGWDSPGPVDDETVEAVVTSLRRRLDLVAFTPDVPRVRKYLTKRFAAPNGQLSPEVEETLDRESLQNVNSVKTIRVSDFNQAELEQLNSTIQLDWALYAAVLGDPRRPFDFGGL